MTMNPANSKLIDAISFKKTNSLHLIVNSLRYRLRNELETQVQKIYIHKKIYISYCLIFIYTLAYVIFTPFYAHARARRQYVSITPLKTNLIGAVAGNFNHLFLQGVSL